VYTWFRSPPTPTRLFTEDFRREWVPGMAEIVQGTISISKAKVLRGLHFHCKQADWWNVYQGAAVVGLYDLRKGSPTGAKGMTVPIDTSEGLKGLYISKGVSIGFYAETDVMLHYMVDNFITGEDEFGNTWDEPRSRHRLAHPRPDPLGPRPVESEAVGGPGCSRPVPGVMSGALLFDVWACVIFDPRSSLHSDLQHDKGAP
jgi:dTDP-4-dehydrorhamnose 3,5-epimerase-like enzyme